MSNITKHSTLAKTKPDESQLKAMAFQLGQSLAKVDKIETNQTQLSQKFSEMNERLSRIESRGLQAQTPYELPDKPTKPYNPEPNWFNDPNVKSMFLAGLLPVILAVGITGVISFMVMVYRIMNPAPTNQPQLGASKSEIVQKG